MARIRTHPGEVLNEEFMVPLGLSARRLAGEIEVPPNRISEIVRGRRHVSADTALRLGRRFGTTPQFWLNLQDAHELSKAEATHDYSTIANPEAEKTAPEKRLTPRRPQRTTAAARPQQRKRATG
jgi:antitoxin HigA-1